MQMTLDFGAQEDMAWVRDRLRPRFEDFDPVFTLTPIGQLVKSSISGRTRDEVSWGAFWRLVRAYSRPADIAGAPAARIEGLISDVTFPDVKARRLGAALRTIAKARPDFDLRFLRRRSVEEAFAWLENLPGVGRKVSASVLNFSTLHMPAFVVDTHILRILRRFGIVRSKADTRVAYDTVMPALRDWSAAGLEELHVLMKRLGQETCHAIEPDCRRCPLSGRCAAAI